MEITKSAWTYCPVVVGAVVVAEAAGDVADAVVVAMVGVSFFFTFYQNGLFLQVSPF